MTSFLAVDLVLLFSAADDCPKLSAEESTAVSVLVVM